MDQKMLELRQDVFTSMQKFLNAQGRFMDAHAAAMPSTELLIAANDALESARSHSRVLTTFLNYLPQMEPHDGLQREIERIEQLAHGARKEIEVFEQIAASLQS